VLHEKRMEMMVNTKLVHKAGNRQLCGNGSFVTISICILRLLVDGADKEWIRRQSKTIPSDATASLTIVLLTPCQYNYERFEIETVIIHPSLFMLPISIANMDFAI